MPELTAEAKLAKIEAAYEQLDRAHKARKHGDMAAWGFVRAVRGILGDTRSPSVSEQQPQTAQPSDTEILDWLDRRFEVRTSTNYIEHRDQLEIMFAIPGIFGEDHADAIGDLRGIIKAGMEYQKEREDEDYA